jgi:hypothetical protein
MSLSHFSGMVCIQSIPEFYMNLQIKYAIFWYQHFPMLASFSTSRKMPHIFPPIFFTYQIESCTWEAKNLKTLIEAILKT